MAHLRALQTGRHGKLSQQLLNEVAAARICLLHAKKRVAYDAELRPKIAAAGPPPLPLPAKDQPDDIDGTVFDHYLMLDLLAQTRTGPIFKARHRPMNRVVAMKVLSGDGPERADLAELVDHQRVVVLEHDQVHGITSADVGERGSEAFRTGVRLPPPARLRCGR